MAEKWMEAQQVDQGYIVIMLTKTNLVNMVMRCCNMTSSSNCPSVKTDFDFKTSQNHVMVPSS